MEIRIMRSVRGIAAALAMVTFSAGMAAQEYVAEPVMISKEKVKIDGKVCYSHIVMERQTLYSISKAYGVSIEDIYKFNPSLRETGLKKNSIILIPSQDAIGNAGQEKKQESPAREYRKESSSDAMQPMQAAEPTVKKPKTRSHVVKWYEDIEGIAMKYGITAEEIIMANGLTGRKLKNRQKLVIPEKGQYVAAAKTELPANAADTEEDMNLDTVFGDDSGSDNGIFRNFIPKNRIKVAMLLPLKATGSTSSRSNMDFYSGALLAAKDMAAEGVDIDLQVHDISSGSMGITRYSLSQTDMVIGPVSSADITKLFAMAPESCILVSPLDPRAGSLVQGYRNMIQAPASNLHQYADMASWIAESSRAGDKVIVISEKEARMNDAGRLMKAAMDSASINYAPFSYSILDGRKIQIPLEGIMTRSGTNRVVIASESEAFVNDVVRNLNLIVHDKYDVVLYGPAKIRSFETIEVENLHNTSLHASLAYFIDYDDDKVRDFLMKYRALFRTEPTQFAFQGYDVTRYFLELCAKYGDNWTQMLESSEMDMLQCRFRCRQIPGGGYANEGIRRIVYGRDWSIEKVK